MKEKFKATVVPKHFLFGIRYLSVLHARLRNNCSNLHTDIFKNHLRESPTCICGNLCEDAEHYLFCCPLFKPQRLILFAETRIFPPLNVELLLWGSNSFDVNKNKQIFAAVQKFIKTTDRFRSTWCLCKSTDCINPISIPLIITQFITFRITCTFREFL
jgi:hypothetical protein